MLRLLMNGVDLEAEGILLGAARGDRIGGWLSPPPMRFDEGELDGIGSVLAREGTLPGRTITIPITVHPAAGTVAARREAEAFLWSLFGLDSWLCLDDGTPLRELLVRVVDITLEPVTPGASVASRGRVIVRGADPRWRATEPTVRALSTTRLMQVLGTAPVDDWEIRIANPAGAITDPQIVIRAPDGTVRTTILVPGTLATTDHLEFLAGRGLAQRWSAGVATSVLTTMTGAFVAIHPGDSIALAAASGTPLGELLFHPQEY
jgi:hypothetical protein